MGFLRLRTGAPGELRLRKTIAPQVPGVSTAPAAFAPSGWGVSDAGTGSSAVVSVSALPDNGGSALTRIEVRIGGAQWQTLTDAPAVGSFPLVGLFTDGVPTSVQVRAVNALGAGEASDTKSVTTSGTAAAPGQMGAPTLTATGTTVVVTLGANPADNGSPITRRDIRYSTDEVNWTELTGVSSPRTITGLSEGTTYSIQARAANAIGAGDWSLTAQITTLTSPTITGVPTISGVAQVGQTLTASAAPVTGDPTPATTWQWERAGTPISGATSASYEVVDADETNTLTVVQTETNSVGNDTAESAATATVAAASTETIDVGAATYSPGGGGSGPSLSISLVTLVNTTGPYTVFVATHANGTTLTKANIEDGTGDAEDNLSFSDADGAVDGQELTLATSLTNGHLSFFIRDSSGTAVESAVIKIDGVNVDATAPTISAVSGAPTGATTASYSVTTNEAGGTIYVRARPSGDSAWTAEQIIAAPDATDTTVEAG